MFMRGGGVKDGVVGVIPKAQMIAIVQSVLLDMRNRREDNVCWAASGSSSDYLGTLQTTFRYTVCIYSIVYKYIHYTHTQRGFYKSWVSSFDQSLVH